MTYLPFKSQYRPVPTIKIDSEIITKSSDIIKAVLATQRKKILIECYPGVEYTQLLQQLIYPLNFAQIIHIDQYSHPIPYINALFEPYLTEDRVFGKMADFQISDLYPSGEIAQLNAEIRSLDAVIVYGFGASLIEDFDLLIYVDITRWEIQQRFRKHTLGNWKISNLDEDSLKKYKRGYFIEWRIADRIKQEVFPRMDLYLEANHIDHLKMMAGADLRTELEFISNRPFRLTPYFDPGVWGGQWMKEVCNLDPSVDNYAWSFDGVPEENSLTLIHNGVWMEIPAMNLVKQQPTNLLGKKIMQLFGAEFPIRFDFLDTMGGQNLSLQVHPLKEYIREQFGMPYTQDESYYILDATENSYVYLGVKDNIDPDAFLGALKQAQQTNQMNVEPYINKIPVKKHDHILIPAGTIHCSGKNTMVLEISATPYIFTFKLWDWNRLGLDGLPRPIHINHGEKVIQFSRNTNWVIQELVNHVENVSNEDGIIEERTGLHALELIETRRYWFDKVSYHHTHGTVNMLNLVEGQHAIVESPHNAFEPFEVYYAETFIIPASVGDYTIRPYGASERTKIGVIKAYIRDAVLNL